jgi:hypothetical protein
MINHLSNHSEDGEIATYGIRPEAYRVINKTRDVPPDPSEPIGGKSHAISVLRKEALGHASPERTRRRYP